MNIKTGILSVSMLFVISAMFAADRTITVTANNDNVDWNTASNWADSTPPAASDTAILTNSGGVTQANVHLGGDSAVTVAGLKVQEVAQMHIDSGSKLTVAKAEIGNNAKIVVRGALDANEVVLNFGTFEAYNATLDVQFTYGWRSKIYIEGSTLNAKGSNFLNGANVGAGNDAVTTFHSSTVNAAASGSSVFLSGTGGSTSTFNFQQGTTFNAGLLRTESGMENFIDTGEGRDVRIGWNNGVNMNYTFNIESGSKFQSGDFNIANAYSGEFTQQGTTSFNVSGSNASTVSSLHVRNLNMGLGSTFGSEFVAEVNINDNARLYANSISIGQNAGAGGKNIVSIDGENAGAHIDGAVNIGSATSAGGESTVYVKGREGSVANFIQYSPSGGVDLNIRLSSAMGSQAKNSFILDGNANFERSDGRRVTLNVGVEENAIAGEAMFAVIGANNRAMLWDVNIGNVNAPGGDASIYIEGFGSTIDVGSSFRLYQNGALRYTVTESGGIAGVSKLILGAGNADQYTLDGYIYMDFTKLVASYEQATRFDLISANADIKALFEEMLADGRLKSKTRDDSDIVEFFYDEISNTIYVEYTSTVPEPAACAAVIGAFALALAAYRRRR